MQARAYNLIEIPGGGFGFTGKVPVDLAYEYDKDSGDLEMVAYYGMGMTRALAEREGRVFRYRVFKTKAEAAAAAAAWEKRTEAFKLPWVDG